MKFDIFFSICQTEVDGQMPNERQMFLNFFDQLQLADDLGFGTAWLAESHLSCEVQKQNPGAVIPNFKGEIGLNTDILQLAHVIFSKTKNLSVGSAIRNILCNGGPIAHAEEVRTFLTLHGLKENENRVLDLGFASGRFPFSNIPYGIRPRNKLEEIAWPALKGKVFQEAVEIFLRFIRGDVFDSTEVTPKILRKEDFRNEEDWDRVSKEYGSSSEAIEIPSFWTFPKVGVIPFEAPLELLRLTIGAHDAATQKLANQFYPCGVFNLSITPTPTIEATHERMKVDYHKEGGAWRRDLMPRTTLVFVDNTPGLSDEARSQKARQAAVKAIENYWRAVEKTLDSSKVENAVNNALVGNPEEVRQQVKEKFHPDDRLMCWFDFNNHNSEEVKICMRVFMEEVAPEFQACQAS